MFFAKNRTHFVQVWPPEPCVEKKPAYRGSPPCTIFLTSREQKNIMQLCTIEVFDRQIIAEDTYEQFSALKNILRCDWSAHIHIVVPQDICEEIERSPGEKGPP